MALPKKGGGGNKKWSTGKTQKHGFVRVSSSRGGNPFDVRSNATKQKHEVIGRRVKGTGRNVSAARAEAERKRHKTLGPEFRARHKSNVMKDKRLGEQDPTLSMEDKMMARFQTERKRKMRNASTFALHDSDSEQEALDNGPFLTHRGAKIAIDDYEMGNVDGVSDNEDDSKEARKMEREIVNQLHFGGGTKDANALELEERDGKRKTHKEVMQEVMMKAKLYKAERQKHKNAQEEATDKLDEGFSDLRGLLEFRPTRANGKEVRLEPMDDFDKMTRELSLEAKVKATERRMSPEEAAAKKRDCLAELEKKRVARMHGADAEDIDSDDAGKRKSKKGKKKANKEKPSQLIVMPPTDDDLTPVYAIDNRFAAGTEEEEVKEEDAEDRDDDEEFDESEEEESEAGFVINAGIEGEDKVTKQEARKEEEDEEVEDKAHCDNDMEKRLHDAEEAAAELPFVFECPESPEELAAIFKKHARKSYEKRGLILERIVTYYNPRLSVENKTKMKRFFAVMVRQFLIFAARYAAHKHDLDLLTETMYTLAQQMGDTAGIVVRELLAQLFKRLHKRAVISAWPTLPELLLFKALTCIFPTSDLRHNVVSPMETLLGESLSRGVVSSPQEATQALFTASLSLDMTRSKERFMPEIVNFLTRILRAFVTSCAADASKNDDPDSNTSIHWLRRDLLEWVSTHSVVKTSALPRLSLAGSVTCTGAQVLSSLLALLDVSSAQYALLPSFDELFYPIYLLLHALVKDLGATEVSEVNAVISKLHPRLENCWKARRPLRLQSFAPTILPTFAPQFDENYTVRKDKTLPKDTAQLKQLQRQVKRARKSAARELRRDAEFIHREKQKEEAARVAAKDEKQKEVRRWLEEQNATFNQQVRKGGHMLKGGGSARGPAPRARTPKM